MGLPAKISTSWESGRPEGRVKRITKIPLWEKKALKVPSFEKKRGKGRQKVVAGLTR